MPKPANLIFLFLPAPPAATVAAQAERTLSGKILTSQDEAVAGIWIIVRSASGERRAESDAAGNFRLRPPAETSSSPSASPAKSTRAGEHA